MPKVTVVQPNGSRVREIRLGLGLSPAAFARTLSPQRSGQTIRDIEKGRIWPSELLMRQISIAHDVPLDDLIIDGEAAA